MKATHVVVFTSSMLRLHDNPCLKFSKHSNAEVIPVLISDRLQLCSDENLDNCVKDLKLRLASKGSKLLVLEGSVESIASALVMSIANREQRNISVIVAESQIHPLRDTIFILKNLLKNNYNLRVHSVNDDAHHDEMISISQDSKFKVFNPSNKIDRTSNIDPETLFADECRLGIKGCSNLLEDYLRNREEIGDRCADDYFEPSLRGESYALQLIKEYLLLGDFVFTNKLVQYVITKLTF